PSRSAGRTSASLARAIWQPSGTSSSSTRFSPSSVADAMRIEIDDGSSLVRPIVNCSTSNDASHLMTVSKITFSSCESIRWPSASTTWLWTACSVMISAQNGHRERRLHVEVEHSDVAEGAVENRRRTGFDCRDERQPIFAIARELDDRVNIDFVPRKHREDVGQDARAIRDREADVMRRDKVVRDLVNSG